MKRFLDNGYLLMIIAVVLWAGNLLIGRGMNEIMPPIGLAFWRWAGALPIFLVLAWPRLSIEWRIALRHWPIVLLLSILSVTLFNVFIYIGLGSTPAINAMLILTARPTIIIALSYLFFGERITAVQGLGFVLGLIGTAIIVLRGNLAILGGVELYPGDFWIVGATVSWAVYTVFLSKRPAIHGTSFMTLSVAIGLVVLTPLYLWEAYFVKPVPIVPETFWSIGYLIVFASVVAFLCYNRAVGLVGANRVALISYLGTAVGSVGAVVLLGEQFRVYHGVGIAVILFGIYLGSRRRPAINEADRG
ncbi:MAG: DMT family transporter [Rhodospirillales bacterium]|nr:DMT family transporter [Rhodospirillales bacterium]MDP6646455.1 DMT family transporter [Rhodospirillales bacterium]